MAAQRANWHGAQELDDRDIEKFDLFCFVKRPVPELMERILKANKIIVFDVVDSWAQPADNLAVNKRDEAVDLFRSKWRGLPQFHAHIFANRAMKLDLAPLTRYGTFIYHHYYPGLKRNPLRRQVETIGYEGNDAYLGPWREVIDDICRRKGLRFVVNPAEYTDIDIGFAARGGQHSGFLPNRYKSNVKLANFYGSGTPCIVGNTEVSYHETDCGSVRFFANAEQLERQVDALLDHGARLAIRDAFLRAAPAFGIDQTTLTYEHFFLQIARRHAAGKL